MKFEEHLKSMASYVENDLARRMDELTCVPLIKKSMTYSLLAGGKRLRAVMLMTVARAYDADPEKAAALASALEMIHAYSLIHDDLPAMDNDDFRRGKPTNHRVFGEGQAILAGDGLLNLAFETMLNEAPNDGRASSYYAACREIARASGVYGMGGGQCIDLDSGENITTPEELAYMDSLKTGALFSASIISGAILGGAGSEDIAHLREFARAFGVLFQITDDILDAVGDEAALGKSTGKDERDGKHTYVTFLGLNQAKARADDEAQSAHEALRSLSFGGGDIDFLHELVDYTVTRDR